jgi:hypothetical protein
MWSYYWHNRNLKTHFHQSSLKTLLYKDGKWQGRTNCHNIDIAEILLKVVLNTIIQTKPSTKQSLICCILLGCDNLQQETNVVSQGIHIVSWIIYLAWSWLTKQNIIHIRLTTTVVIGTDCTCSCKSIYHTIKTTTVPFRICECRTTCT